MEMDENERKQMKEDIIKLFISNHVSSRAPPNHPSSKFMTTKSSCPRMEKVKTLMEDHLPSMFTANHITPTHPPYALMIQEAIKKLKGRGDTTNMKSIEKYISTNFEGLPWAASQFLKHYLQKLVDSGDITYASTTSSYHPRGEEEASSKEKHRNSKSKEKHRKPKSKASSTRDVKDMILVSPSVDDVQGLEQAVIDVEPLQKQMPETNHIEESLALKHHVMVEPPIAAEKSLLVYHRRRKKSSPCSTIVEANGTGIDSDHNDLLAMIVHTPKTRRPIDKEKWLKFQESQPKREILPRRARVLPGSSLKNKQSV